MFMHLKNTIKDICAAEGVELLLNPPGASKLMGDNDIFVLRVEGNAQTSPEGLTEQPVRIVALTRIQRDDTAVEPLLAKIAERLDATRNVRNGNKHIHLFRNIHASDGGVDMASQRRDVILDFKVLYEQSIC